jgi:hypothetical protein
MIKPLYVENYFEIHENWQQTIIYVHHGGLFGECIAI